MLETLYATDERLLLRAPSDFAYLVPDGQKIASGEDGVFQSDERWILVSATVDFVSRGVIPGNIAVLSQPAVRGSRFGTEGETLVVVSVSENSVTLRRQGFAEGVGEPPGGPSGTSGVRFEIVTVVPQIEMVVDDINRKFGIDPTRIGRTPSDIRDLRELESLTTLETLSRLYADTWRDSRSDVWQKKAIAIERERAEAEGRVRIRWTHDENQSITSMFNTRISR